MVQGKLFLNGAGGWHFPSYFILSQGLPFLHL